MDYIWTCYKEVRPAIKRSQDIGNLWTERDDGIVESFAGFAQLIFD